MENIKNELDSTHPIIQNEKTGVYILNLNSKIMKNDLMTLHGIMPNKAQNLKFPNVPDAYLSHFIRGYFDGDGYINYEQYTTTLVSGSKNFTKSLLRILNNQCFKTQLQKQGNSYRIHIRGRKSIQLFASWIYKNKDERLYLTRKYKIFNKEKLPLNKLADRALINTHAAVKERKLNFLAIFSVINSIEFASQCIGVKPRTVEQWIYNDESFNKSFSVISKSHEN